MTRMMTSTFHSASGNPLDSPAPVKILIVDDQPDNLLSVGAVLEALGEEVVRAESGRQALLRVLDSDFAVIVLDVMMPDMDGFETAALIRQRERSRHTPIIFLTALGLSEEHILRGYELGAVDYITKPFVPEILRSKVAVFLELKRKSLLLTLQSQALAERNEELNAAIQRSRLAEEQIKALNRHLEQRLEELAEVNRELEAFSYTVSHDLRAPLSRVGGFSRALLDFHAEQLDDEGRLYLGRIERSAQHMCDLVEDLLNFSRLTCVEVREQAIDLSALVRAIAAELTAREPDRTVEFAIESGVTAWGDLVLLRAAILNLIENAWKFTRRCERARIEFGLQRENGSGVFFVRDNGAGFDMTDAERLFRPFQRLHRDSDYEGTGIGLATVDRIIRRHGGRIWAEGAADQGAVFFFTLGEEASR